MGAQTMNGMAARASFGKSRMTTTTELRSEPCREPAGSADSATERRSTGYRWFARLILAGYVTSLCIFGVISRLLGSGQGASVLQLQYLLQPFDWIVVVATDGVVEIAEFLLMGFLVSLSVGRPANRRGLVASLLRPVMVLLAGVGLSFVVLAAESGRLAGPVFLVLPLTGYLLGAWIGATWLRGYRAILWLVPKLGLLLLTLTAGIAGFVLLALDDAPLPFEPPSVTSAEKRRVWNVVGSRREVGNGVQQLRLSERDVNSLLALAMSHSPFDGKVRVAIDQGGFAAELSLRTPFRSRATQYLNVEGACKLDVTDGRMQLSPEGLRIGRVKIPKIVQDIGVPPLVSALLDDPDIGQGVALIDSLRLESGTGEMVYRSGGFRKSNLSSLLAKLGQKPDVLLKTEVHFRHLVSEAESLPEGDQRFVAFVQTASELARQRSHEQDPVLENRAAILALGILLGHSRVEELVGPVTDGDLRQAARRHVGRVTLRGRGDWTRHFFVSAALALLSNEDMSDGVGLFKEELDAGEGGSGFSFSDLLADRAGTLFALAATRDEQSARKMQERLAAGFPVDELFPLAADLPEGISDPELETLYGGVGGRDYTRVIQDIERRLAACAALNPP